MVYFELRTMYLLLHSGSTERQRPVEHTIAYEKIVLDLAL